MPSKIQLDENLWFLYICLQNSDLKAIDFNAVGHHTNLKPPAARMRYTRLRRQIENGTLIGTHGTPFSSPSVKIAEAIKRRKRGNREPNSNSDSNLSPNSDYKTLTSKPIQSSGGKGEDEEGGDEFRARKRKSVVGAGEVCRGEAKIKQEMENTGRGGREGIGGEGEEDAEFEDVSVNSSDEFTDADSEDEIPLAKRMRTARFQLQSQFQSQFPEANQNSNNDNNNYQSPFQHSSNQFPPQLFQQQRKQHVGNYSGPGSGNLSARVGAGVGVVSGPGTPFSRQQEIPRYPNHSGIDDPQRQSQSRGQNPEQASYDFGNHLFANQHQHQQSQMASRFREDDAHIRDHKAGWSFGQGNYRGMGNGQ